MQLSAGSVQVVYPFAISDYPELPRTLSDLASKYMTLHNSAMSCTPLSRGHGDCVILPSVGSSVQ